MSEWNTRATLAGEFLYAKENISWSITSGTEYFSTSFPVKPAKLEKLLQAGEAGPVKLSIENPTGDRVDVEKVWITGEVPSGDPRWRRIGVADIRWPLKRGHLIKKYNMRTFTGSKRVVGTTLGLLGVTDPITVDDLWFKRFSLDTNTFPPTVPLEGAYQTPYTATRMLMECLQEINRVYPEIEYELNSGILAPYNDLAIEDFSVDGIMDEVLGSILSWISAINLYADLDGKLKIYDRTKGGELEILNALGYQQEGFGHAELISHKHSCPINVCVIYTPKAEIRFDRLEDTDENTYSPDPAEGRYLEPVIQVVDKELAVKDKAGKITRTAYRGEYILVDEWLTSLSGVDGVALTHDKIQTYMFTGGMLNSWANVSDELKLSHAWTRRIASLDRCYRRVFRPNRRWVDRVLGFENKRIAVVDTESGYRPPSSVYMDYCIRHSDRGIVASVKGGGEASMMKNIPGYHVFLDQAESCPYASIQFLDNENGVFAVNLARDEWEHIDKIIPCFCENIPTYSIATLRQTTTPRFRSEKTKGGKYGKMAPEQKISVILTASPATNNQDSYYKVFVSPAQMTEFGLDLNKITPALGPTWYIRVSPGQMTANVAWLDAYAGHIERIFGIGNGPIDWDKILTNKEILDKLARAYAFSQVYSKFITKWEGSKTGKLNPNVKPNGSVGTITHFVSKAVSRTTAQVLNEGYPRRIESLLDAGTRAQVFGMVKQ